MAGTGMARGRGALLESVEKIAASAVLRSSESLCGLLRYLARQWLDQPGVSPKEYQIATEVFGRSPDFDSRLDSTVRVQTGRLRAKLAEYYGGPGRKDDLIISIPKGSYSLSVNYRGRRMAPPTEPARPVPNGIPEKVAGTAAPARQAPTRRWMPALVAAAVIALVGYAFWRTRAASETGQPRGAVATFWQIFLAKKQAPLVIYSNAEFVGAPASGMHYFNPATDSPRDIRDHYTGVGEVVAVHELDLLFARFGCQMRLKRGRLLTWDDAKGGDLIFIGSTAENLSLRDLPEQRDFTFKLKDRPPRAADVAIVNLKPGPGEEPFYMSSEGLPITEDHALIALLPAFEAGHWVLILAGTTTLGTQAAAEYICRPEALQELVKRLHLTDPANPVPFEAVIKAQINGGVPVQTQIVALHVRPQRRP